MSGAAPMDERDAADASGEHAVDAGVLVCLGCHREDLEVLARWFTLELPCDADELARVLATAAPVRRGIVLDCRATNPLALALLAAAPADVGDSVIVLWGASRIELSAIRRRFHRARTVLLDRGATAPDITAVMRCALSPGRGA